MSSSNTVFNELSVEDIQQFLQNDYTMSPVDESMSSLNCKIESMEQELKTVKTTLYDMKNDIAQVNEKLDRLLNYVSLGVPAASEIHADISGNIFIPSDNAAFNHEILHRGLL